jgi:hypothetical protein
MAGTNCRTAVRQSHFNAAIPREHTRIPVGTKSVSEGLENEDGMDGIITHA